MELLIATKKMAICVYRTNLKVKFTKILTFCFANCRLYF